MSITVTLLLDITHIRVKDLPKQRKKVEINKDNELLLVDTYFRVNLFNKKPETVTLRRVTVLRNGRKGVIHIDKLSNFFNHETLILGHRKTYRGVLIS